MTEDDFAVVDSTSPDESMRQLVAMTTLVVRDYDEAIDFYVNTLGFELIEDTVLEQPDKRWVTVAPHGSTESRLLLARAVGDEQTARIGNQTGGRVFLFLHTDDFWRDYHEYQRKGVPFMEAPREESRTGPSPYSATPTVTFGICYSRAGDAPVSVGRGTAGYHPQPLDFPLQHQLQLPAGEPELLGFLADVGLGEQQILQLVHPELVTVGFHHQSRTALDLYLQLHFTFGKTLKLRSHVSHDVVPSSVTTRVPTRRVGSAVSCRPGPKLVDAAE